MEKKLNFHRCGFRLTKCSHGLHLNQVPFPNDRISSLPVELLSIILSLLSLKEMIRTNILSKRWLNLWVNTPVLDFHLGAVCENKKKADYTVKLVNNVLQQHKGLYLKEFRIHCMIQDNNQVDIDGWLDFALAKKVEILELDFSNSGLSFYQDYNYVFPIHWFTKGRVVQYNLKLLKWLSLKSVNVTSEAVHFFLRNCPFLERLQVVGSNKLVDLVISDPTLVLKYLQIKYCLQLKVMSISNFNLVSLDTTFGSLILKNLPMLVELSILGFSSNSCLTGILSLNATCLIHLTSLELYAHYLEELTELPSNLAQMTKLKRLVIGCVPEYHESLNVILYIMKSCYRLEEFVFQMGWFDFFDRLSRRIMPCVERISFDSLKVFEFRGYYGRFSDVELMMHVAMNSPRLEKIIIDSFNASKINPREDIRENEREARRFAMMHIEDLKKSKHIQPHVDVCII